MSCKMLLLVAAVQFATGASAQEFAAKGSGATSCSEFEKMYKLDPSAADDEFYNWALGFMSGWNFANATAGQPTRNLNATAPAVQETYLRQYCDQQPSQFYIQGAKGLFLSLPLIRPQTSK